MHKKLLILLVLLTSQSVFSEEVLVLGMQKSTPYVFFSKTKPRGYVYDLAKEMLKMANLSYELELDSWSSIFTKAVTDPSAILLTTVRTKDREKLFSWIGPIEKFNVAIIAKKNSGIKINSLEDLGDYKIASMKNVFAEKIFKKQGGDVKKLLRVSRQSQLVKLLQYNRVDAVLFNDIPFLYTATQSFDNQEYEYVKILKEVPMYIAININMKKEIVDKLKKAYATISKKNTNGKSRYDELKANYMK